MALLPQSTVVVLLSTSIFSGWLGFREVLSLYHCRSSQQVRPAMSYKDNKLFLQLLILKYSQNFLQCRLSALLGLTGRFVFGGKEKAIDPGYFIRMASEEKILCSLALTLPVVTSAILHVIVPWWPVGVTESVTVWFLTLWEAWSSSWWSFLAPTLHLLPSWCSTVGLVAFYLSSGEPWRGDSGAEPWGIGITSSFSFGCPKPALGKP